ncbi:MAG: DJ-1/PfpI family protein [Gammaproteobacteria bacterium]|nr:DJ-1/PfpI family protein [Gammaproteobacteria bacterium]
MATAQDYIFVLWGDHFEEAVATIFVTELRKAGLRVKVVGLSQRRTRGAHGLSLVPDLTLEEALPLANRTACLIIPCPATGLNRLASDPRLADFLHQAQANQATIVVGNGPIQSDLLPMIPTQVTRYPGQEDLVAFAREVAHQFK